MFVLWPREGSKFVTRLINISAEARVCEGGREPDVGERIRDFIALAEV